MTLTVPTWDYDASVCEVKGLVSGWKSITVDIVEKLYEARFELSHPGRPKTGQDCPVTWAGYCDAIGLPKRTANNWLSLYNPETRQLEDKRPKAEPEPEAVEEEAEAEPVEEEPNLDTFIAEPTGAATQARAYISIQLTVLKDDIDRHEFVNALLKYLKEKSIELGRGA